MKLYCHTKHLDYENTLYPHKQDITSIDEFALAVDYDHVMGNMLQSYRKLANWNGSDVLFGDIDNGHSEDPDDWITLGAFDEMFSGYEYYIATSKSHQKEKNGKPARDRFHVYFPLPKEVKDIRIYSHMLLKLMDKYGFFDPACKDASRQFFGNPEAEVYYNSGKTILKDIINHNIVQKPDTYERKELTFKSGSRNQDFLSLAVRLYKSGMDQSWVEEFVGWVNDKKTDRPLTYQEINTILRQAHKYGQIK